MNDNEQNGLFSEEYESPKRENPYLKKNRDKAKAEKQKKEKPRRDENPYAEAEDKPTYAPAAEPDGDESGYTRKRTFSDWIFEHVKLIATVATVLVVLALVLITDVVDIVGDLVTGIQQVDSREITLTYVKGVSEKSEPAQWSDFERFRHEVSKADDSVTWKLTVEGNQYELWVTGVNTDYPPTQVWLIDWNTGDRMTLGEDDLDTFLAEHTEK